MQLIRQFNSLKFVQQNGSGGYELSFGIFNPKKCYMVSTCFNCVLTAFQFLLIKNVRRKSWNSLRKPREPQMRAGSKYDKILSILN